MIKLTLLRSDFHPVERTFSTPSLIIGFGSDPEIDFSLPSENQPPGGVLRIVQQGSRYSVINLRPNANISLNHLHFETSQLRSGDHLLINTIEILFEEVSEEEKDIEFSDEEFNALLSSLKQENTVEEPSTSEFNFEKEMESLSKISGDDFESVDLTDQDIAKLLEEIRSEDADQPPMSSSLKEESLNPSAPYASEPVEEPIPSLFSPPERKYFEASEEESSNEEADFDKDDIAPRPQSPYDKIARMMAMTLILLITLGLFGTGSYFLIVRHNETNEAIAARTLADLSMTLTEARLIPPSPLPENASDPRFLKLYLTKVLPAGYQQLLTSLISSGQLRSSDYLFKIYTTSDLSSFLLIAKPLPSFFQRLAPKSALIIVSDQMELRKTKDLSVWKKLLKSSNSLDSINPLDIANLSDQAEIVSLPSLDTSHFTEGFASPPELASLHPGAENFIYNAPRYYPFCQRLLNQAAFLGTDSGTAQNINTLFRTLEKLSSFKEMVFYSSQGEEAAVNAYKGLKAYVPGKNFTFGYLSVREKSGSVTKVSLLTESVVAQDQNLPPQLNASVGTRQNAPLYLYLSQLATTHQMALQLIDQQIGVLLDQNNERPIPDFEEQHEQLISLRELVNRKLQMMVVEALDKLYQEYIQNSKTRNLPLLVATVKAVGLETYVPVTSVSAAGKIIRQQNARKQLPSLLKSLKNSTSLESLDPLVKTLSELITSNNIPNPATLVYLQNALRREALHKIGDLVLSNTQRPNDFFKRENRFLLENVLRNANISDLAERNYYLHEFDLLLEQR